MTTSGGRQDQARKGSGRVVGGKNEQWEMSGEVVGGGRWWWEAKKSGERVVGGDDEWWEAK